MTKFGELPLTESNKINLATVGSETIPASTSPNFQCIVQRYSHLFTGDDDPYGFCERVQHEIPIKEGEFRAFGARRVPLHLEEEVKRQVQQMLQEGIIEEARSAYNSPVLLVKKPNGKFRFCVDFRRLNAVTINKPVYVPSVSEIFDQLQGAKVFSVFDLRSGYRQVPIKLTDREKTAFAVGNKPYQFKRMPFGLSGAHFTFRLLMLKLLEGISKVVVYGDDIVVYSSTTAEHERHLEKVLKRIQQSGLRINGSKSQIGKPMLTLLCHKVGNGEVRPLPEKILRLKELERPTSKRSLRRFLGCAAYYSRFVQGFTNIAEPLYALLKKERRFQWTQ